MRLLAVLCAVTAVAGSIHNNMIGQPEIVQLLGLSNDEENHLSPMPYSGTYHFVSSTFPDDGLEQRNGISNEVDSRGFHESVFGGIGDYYPSWPGMHYKRAIRDYGPGYRNYRKKRSTLIEKNLNDTKVEKIGKRAARNRFGRGMEMGSSGFHGDIFNSGFGDFLTMKKRRSILKRGADMTRLILKMRNDKRRPEMDSMGFHGDTFGGGFGDFDTMKKRRPEMDSMGFHGDTFGGGFGEFDTMKKRRPEMDSMGFHGDTFGGGFGDFDTMKKRRPEMDSMGFHGDTFGGGFGDFDTMKKRRPEMDSMGFHGDTFGGGFGDFDTMKKRRPEMDSMGFHGDTFGGGFGDFDTMKKRIHSLRNFQRQPNKKQN